MASQPTLTPSWKQEVHRRVAAHNSRRGLNPAEREMPAEARHGSSSRAAQVAARVAARYAKTPSYSQLQAAEARTAVRAAEIATEVALEAQAAARAVLAGLESAGNAESGRDDDIPAAGSVNSRPSAQSSQRPPIEFHLEPGTAVRPERTAKAKHSRQQSEVEVFPSLVEQWWQSDPLPSDPLGARELDRIEAALSEVPIHANLIEFPREQADTRNARPRIADTSHSTQGDAAPQLSIFEVDPATVSSVARELPVHSGTSQWSGIELEAHPLDDVEPQSEPATEAGKIELASFSRRLMAAVVDGALIVGACVAAALLAAYNMDQLPSPRLIELGSAAALFVMALLYQALFFTMGDGTPGMKYARISLCTFDDQSPSRAQLHGRLGAMLLSVLPLGLGLAWAIFDEDHLSWHDRLSKTYQRRSDVPIRVD